jgi:hypothetical protein
MKRSRDSEVRTACESTETHSGQEGTTLEKKEFKKNQAPAHHSCCKTYSMERQLLGVSSRFEGIGGT